MQTRTRGSRSRDGASHRAGRLAGHGAATGRARPLEDVMHYDHDDMSKYASNEGIIEFLRELRGLTRPRCHDEPKRSE
jgi:hypothetical protein